ncbi:MAG: nicotinate (nicotinamide) nucleotide adenylyltransferase [Fusobacterium necrophorum]|nr:nicotinate (nicotinamide) nucleotide adenylyltransferase [Fusobacterium necrophorum]MCI7681497.1 nicotinate (nicotinamide) nucleotide adenylyltransferase [Fusobacterium necrophorum]MDY2573855.1 nicotinate (nicotinamide) nucleotide adenylyltransferase [Fusobacterium necrophorum]MDY6172555.1 nicotinate (nicotinamide) nucleotide adenylyltransferase [Fusobacterium necrophorum]
MKIGIYGGSFNPIHLGHQKIIEFVLETMKLDKILVIPVGLPSHRKNTLEQGFHRFAMCQLAFEHLPRVEVSDLEINLLEVSYTYDTLVQIRQLYGEEHEYFEIIGEDSLASFSSWKCPQEILKLAKLLVLQREPFELISENPNIILLNSPIFPISSTEIREQLQRGTSKIDWLNPKVFQYIQEHNLYKNQPKL